MHGGAAPKLHGNQMLYSICIIDYTHAQNFLHLHAGNGEKKWEIIDPPSVIVAKKIPKVQSPSTYFYSAIII